MPESFEETEAWQPARELARQIYALCRSELLARDFGLRDQLRRAAVSVMNTLAEGWETIHPAEKKPCYNYARRSCGEVRSMTYVLPDNNFLSTDEQSRLLSLCQRTGRMVTGLIRSVRER